MGELTGYEEFIGKKVAIRGVTFFYTGELVAVNSMSVKLENAAWIADTGRFNEFLKRPGKSSQCEVEPFPRPATIGLYSIVDCTEIDVLLTEVQ